MARIREILAEGDRLNAERLAREAAAKRTTAPSFEFEPYEPEDWPPATPAPQKRISSNGIPLPASQMRQTEPSGTATPPRRNEYPWLAIGGSLAAIFALAWLADNGLKRPIAVARSIGALRRRYSAALIVIGLTIVAASLTILRNADLGYDYHELEKALDAGWLTFAGAIVTIIGIYDKLRATSPPEI